MVLYREIGRSAAFAWSPGPDLPILATGSKAGVLDTDFSSDSRLELWDLHLDSIEPKREPTVVASLKIDDRFNDLDWIHHDDTKSLIAGALQGGVVRVWDASALLSNRFADATVYASPGQNHEMKRVQFNPLLKNIAAATDASGQVHLIDVAASSISNPVTIGTTGSLNALDWNKKTATILATGDSLGTISIIRTDATTPVLTIKKPVSTMSSTVTAVAWDPDRVTSLAAGVVTDGQHKVVVWDMRNTSAPVRELLGHTSAITSLSWCRQDADLLLSSSQDYQTCWNPHTGEELVQTSNDSSIRGVFETRFHPHNPSILASASFENGLSVLSIQNTKVDQESNATASSQAADDDFFDKFSPAPKTNSFSIRKAPKWMKRPVGARFGFGGKLVVFSPSKGDATRSSVRIVDLASDSSLKESSAQFEQALSTANLDSLLDERIDQAASEDDRLDWVVIKSLRAGDIRKKIPQYLGFPLPEADAADAAEAPAEASTPASKPDAGNDDDDAAFFDNFTSLNITAEEPAKTAPAEPFQMYPASSSAIDKEITKAVISGSFGEAVKICQDQNRWTDAFLIAICGGEKWIGKVKEAYFEANPPKNSYLRLVSSVTDKNLADLVQNGDLADWKDVLVTICTFASDSEFASLVETLGDRLQADSKVEAKYATLCYLAGSRLDKVVDNWIQDLHESEAKEAQTNETDDLFSIHARFLQAFIEKVTVFREATRFVEPDRDAAAEWRLSALYAKYLEYADVVASVGQLDIADKYLRLLPAKFSDVESARRRVKPHAVAASTGGQAGSRAANPARATGPARLPSSSGPAGYHPGSQQASNMRQQSPYTALNSAPAYHQASAPNTHSPYSSVSSSRYGPGPGAPSSVPPSASMQRSPPKPTGPIGTWNDLPEGFAAAPKRPASAASQPKVNPYGTVQTPPPPPRTGTAPPKGSSQSFGQQISRPSSVSSNLYAPPAQGPIRSASPYEQPASMTSAPPKGNYSQRPPSGPPPANRYAPSPVPAQPVGPGPLPGLPTGLGSLPAGGQAGVAPPPVMKPIAPPPNPYAALANKPPAPPPNPYAMMGARPPIGGVNQTPPPPPLPKGPPRGPPKGSLTSPPPRVSSAQPDNLPLRRPSAPPEPHPDLGLVYTGVRSLWNELAPTYSKPDSPALQAALDSLGGAISQNGLSGECQGLLHELAPFLDRSDYAGAKNACKERLNSVPAHEKGYVATMGRIFVEMGQASRRTAM